MFFLFWLALLGTVFSYFIYPLILMLIPARKIKADVSKAADEQLTISFIVTAYNEEARIEEKLHNTLKIDYPSHLLEVIVASDCSSDNTDDIVKSYADKGIKLVRADAHKGKEYAQLCAIKASTGSVIVFSDVATQIEPNALTLLAKHFNDETVGAVSSEDRFVSQDGSVVGEGAYVKYEMWLRRLESRRAGLVGLSGSFFAARREVCDEWDIYSPSDFNTALNCAKKGLTAISSSDVVGIYSDVKDASLEYRRKLRTIIRGITAISRHPEVLNPLKMGLFSFQVLSHKICRWAVPWFMALLFVTSLLLFSDGWFYAVTFLGQIAFYAVVVAGHFSSGLRERGIVKIPYFFVQVNLAIARATIMFVMGKRMTTWTPSKR